MIKVYELVEKIEPGHDPLSLNLELIKTWRTYVLSLNDEIWYFAFGDPQNKIARSVIALCDEIVIEQTNNIRICGQRFAEKMDTDDPNLSSLVQSILASWGRSSFPDSEKFVQTQCKIQCAHLNTHSMQQIGSDIEELRKLPMVVRNNSENRSLLMFAENVLYYFTRWYKEAGLTPPVEMEKFWPEYNETHDDEVKASTPKPNQDRMKDKFVGACRKLGLQKNTVIPNNILYEIGVQLYPNLMPAVEAFQSGEKMYNKLRAHASQSGYANKQGKQ